MGKITKPMQAKHKETLSPWLGAFVESAAKEPLPLLPTKLKSFPSRWPFGRGDLYHWSSLLNRFDTILEYLCSTYQLREGPQSRDFGCELLMHHAIISSDFEDSKTWTRNDLEALGYNDDGDRQLLVTILQFTRMLLENCGNRSIYASSSHLNALLHTTSLTVLIATLEVSYELAQRYQASVKRIANSSRHISSALLANHYNIELERVQQLAVPFVKTPLIRLTENPSDTSSSVKGKEKLQQAHRKQAATMHANDLTAIVASDNATWKGWADVKIPYYPENPPAGADKQDNGCLSHPSTPTPLRRTSSSTTTPQRPRNVSADDSSPIMPKTPVVNDFSGGSGEKVFEIPQSVVVSTSIYDLIQRIPADMSPAMRYEAFNRLRTAKAITGSVEQRQELLGVRLLAITNLAYVHTESSFLEKVLRHDNDEIRRFQLVYQLAELIRPSNENPSSVPLWLQTITLALLDIIAQMQSKSQAVVSALSANVNHGVLMYVLRRTVASMRADEFAEEGDQATEMDQWHKKLLALTQNMALHLRVGPEIVSAGLMELLIDILKLRSKVAIRNHSAVLQFLDSLVWHHPNAFTSFFSSNGLDAITDLIVDSVVTARQLESEGKGTSVTLRSSAVDYSVPYYQQQTIKGLLKFVHHMMTSSVSFNGNTDRLLRNLVDKQDFLKSLKLVIDDKQKFGAVVWTHTVTLLGDLINNDPTSYAAISEAGLINTYLEVVTNAPLPENVVKQTSASTDDADANASSGDSNASMPDVDDDRPHPPTFETLEQMQRSNLAGGILPSGDAIAIVPQILNSISLNNSGMKLVIASRAMDSFLEIFESPAHVKCLQADPERDDLAGHVGASFDELARHHPRLRKVISNAVVDMVARVRFMGIKNAEDLGWGARLSRASVNPGPKSGDQGNIGETDIKMSDAPAQAGLHLDKETTPQNTEDMNPYMLAVGHFLSAYFANHQLKESFIDAGGIQLLLDLISSPALSWDFPSQFASKIMGQVICLLIEHAPVRGIFPVFHRAQAALDTLQPLANRPEAAPAYFDDFISSRKGQVDYVQPDEQPAEDRTSMVKALIDGQLLLKVLAEVFVAGRHQTLHLPPVNAYDLYTRLIESVGNAVRGLFAEVAAESQSVPAHWDLQRRKKDESGKVDSGKQDSPGSTSAADTTLPQTVSSDQVDSGSSSAVKLTPQEEASPEYRNYKMLYSLQTSFSTSAHPLLHSLGRALLNRRDLAISTDDGYARARQIEVLRAMSGSLLPHLQSTTRGLETQEATLTDYRAWLDVLSTLNQMLFDRVPSRDRSSPLLSVPVLLAFKEQNGLQLLNKLMRAFASGIKSEHDSADERSTLATQGLRQILDIYQVLANAKLVSDACNASSLQWPRERAQSNLASQFVIESRTIILPAVLELWDSTTADKIPDFLVKRLLETLKAVIQGDQEGISSAPKELFLLLDVVDVRFKWTSSRRQFVETLCNDGFAQDLAVEAVYRSSGDADKARVYCADHVKGIAGPRTPVPPADFEGFSATPPVTGASENPSPHGSLRVANDAGETSDPPIAGTLQDVLARIRDAEGRGQALDEEAERRTVAEDTGENAGLSQSPLAKLKAALDVSRSHCREHLIDRCLDIIRVHPGVVLEVSDLIQVVMSFQPKSSTEFSNSHEDVGTTLASALSSLALNEDEQTQNARCVAAFAHLLAVLLRDEKFLDANQDSLRGNVNEYVAYLKPPSPAQDSIPPWVPYILLILEILLCRDARPDEYQWTAPKSLDDTINSLVVRPRDMMVDDAQRLLIVSHVLDLLPRVGKDDVLAVSTLRILVIMTRDPELAKVVGEKRNLQRLFLMAKQLSGFGSDRMKRTKVSSHLLAVLRHIIEDAETIKQVMRDEIAASYPAIRQGSNRREVDTKEFVKAMHPTVLRSPKMFAEVMNEVFTCQWIAQSPDASRTHYLVLKENDETKSAENKEQGSEDVKQSTEEVDQEMSDVPKSIENKRPTLDNPDGVVHFLLCELLAYRDVEDPPSSSADTKVETLVEPATDSSSTMPSPTSGETANVRDKSSTRPAFKAEDHPLFIYRCLILGCLTELVQSYNKAKIEFINFKRSAHPLSTITPIKPRSTVLNYLIYDLLCHGNLSGTADSIEHKKRAAMAFHTQKLLVALVSKTRETPRKVVNKFELDRDSDLLFVRKFVLDIVLKAYEKTPSSEGSMETRYARLQSLAELMHQMIGDTSSRGGWTSQRLSQMQLRRLMYEKGYLDKLTSSIAEINLKFPGVKRAIKYVLRVLQTLTDTAKKLSQANILPSDHHGDDGDEGFDSSSSLSSLDDDDREETPDLYRNSALGMLEPRGEDDESDSEGEEEDEEMYGEEYDEEMDYGDETLDDAEDNISDEDEDLTNMGEIEGLHGEPGVVEVIMDDDDDDHSGSGESDGDEDDADSDDMDDIEDDVEILDEEGNPLDDDVDSHWEDESDGEDEEDNDDDVDDDGIDREGEAMDMAEAPNLDNIESFGDFTRAILGEARPPQDTWDDYDDQYDEEYPEEEDDEGDDEDLEDQYIYQEEGVAADNQSRLAEISGLGWDGRRHVASRSRDPNPAWVSLPLTFARPSRGGGGRDLGELDFRNFLSRSHVLAARPTRPGMLSHAPSAEEDINPLLRRGDAAADSSTQRRSQNLWGHFDGPFSRHDSDTAAILGEIAQSIPGHARRGDVAFHLRFRGPVPGGIMTDRDMSWMPRPRGENRRESGEPQHAAAFTAEVTRTRYEEEARMVFGAMAAAEATKIVPCVLAKLLPAAMDKARQVKAQEAEKRKKEDEERRKIEQERAQKLAQEAEEAAARQRQEEERQAREAAAREQDPHNRQDAPAAQGQNASPMEGVEATNATTNAQPGSSVLQGSGNDPRVVTMISGEEVDVTELGIDPEYLAALPEEFRAEVIAQAVSSRRSQAREDANTGESTEVFREFLDALPDELRLEIEQQERQDQRRRNREESRRQATPATAQDALHGSDMDAGSILMTFPPALREQVLMEQGSEILDQLPPELASQARSMMEHQRRHHVHSSPAVPATRNLTVPRDPSTFETGDDTKATDKPVRRSVVQMLDKAGVATLLRLMFIAQQGSVRVHLFNVLADVCENRQNRLEVISTVLQILQEGSVDMYAVERSFSHLSLKARKQKDKDLEQRTPQSLKRTLTGLSVTASAETNSEISPLLIIQQCLDLLVELANKSQHICFLFISEHDLVGSTLKRAMSRKGKGKDKDTRAHKFAINSLLALLDRDLIMDSSLIMAHLAELLNRVTSPLQIWDRRRKEAAANQAAGAEKGKTGDESQTQKSEATHEVPSRNATDEVQASGPEVASAGTAENKHEDNNGPKREHQGMPAPFLPEHYLTLVIRIFVARECSSKTFQNTIATIKNLSLIDGNKTIFGQELVKQARDLSQNIVKDLDELLPQIEKASSGTEVQGVALSKFSPGASEQNKLLRVLTALDHLFDSKKDNKIDEGETESTTREQQREKDDFLTLLYQNSAFASMWAKLSACLKAIHERENMLNVATILLPLIESLMVVCKNTTNNDDTGDVDKGLVLSSPQPESEAASLFFTFTEEHRRILNELVRNNPKLMSGTFSLLVKNPKVLEFDNKRNFFNRSVHSRNGPPHNRPSYPTLQLSVRREHVFLDSFKHLYFKSGDEMKYGKLNIRFNGEEGVDAGGVSREWFQAMSRQMFDPNYALFTPVSSDRTTFHPNSLSGINDEHLMFFKFIGRIIGKALYEGRVLDCYFSRAVYKRILGKSVSVKDMESFDPDYYKSLCWMLENDITDTIIETFSVEDDAFGVTTTVDLIPDGRNIAVTEQNKSDYVRLVVEHKLLSSVKDQMENFLKGFHEIIPAELISIFNEQELELLISGLPDIDIDDWKSNTEYQNYTPSSPQIQWFWRAVRSFDKEERAKLLQFVTGTSKVPLNGFKELEGMNGISRFNIHRAYGDKDRLPTSHTCFNQLDIPEYESYDALRSQFMKAITAGSEYFGFA